MKKRINFAGIGLKNMFYTIFLIIFGILYLGFVYFFLNCGGLAKPIAY